MRDSGSENAPTVQGRGVESIAQAISKALPPHDSAPAASVTTLGIAELVGKRHDNVRRTVETLIGQGVIVRPQIEDEHGTDAKGRPRSTLVYRFVGEQGKRDSIVVVAQLSPKFTARLVDRWAELEALLSNQRFLPNFTDPASAARAWADEHEAKAAAEAKVQALAHQVNRQAEVIEYQRPAADFVARYVDSTGTRSIREVAKQLGAKETDFIRWLEQDGILFRHHEHGRLLPKAEHQHAGRFVVKAGVSTEMKMWSQTRFTARGATWIAARWEKKKAADAAGGEP